MKIFNYLFQPELNNLRLSMNASLAQPLQEKSRNVSNKSAGKNKRQKSILIK